MFLLGLMLGRPRTQKCTQTSLIHRVFRGGDSAPGGADKGNLSGAGARTGLGVGGMSRHCRAKSTGQSNTFNSSNNAKPVHGIFERSTTSRSLARSVDLPGSTTTPNHGGVVEAGAVSDHVDQAKMPRDCASSSANFSASPDQIPIGHPF